MQKFLRGEVRPNSISPMVSMRPVGVIQSPREVWHVDENNNILEVVPLEKREEVSNVSGRRTQRFVKRDGLTRGMVACL